MSDRPPRHWGRRLLFAVVVVVAVAVGAWFVFARIVAPAEPGAFYDPPSELPAGPAGTVIRDETIDPNADGQRAWKVLYTSTDPSGAPIAVSGVIVAPDGAPPAGGWPVVAWAHGTTGIQPPCAPSVDLPKSGQVRVPELDQLVAAGNVVAITDYPGLGTPGIHPYLVGESEGRSILDSVRAARSLLGDDVNATAVVYGHSQGGHAALWADQIAATYAPELTIAGVAAMAPPTELGELLDDDKAEAAGIVLLSLAITSWDSFYPDTDPATIVKPIARPFVKDIGRHCIATNNQGLVDAPAVIALQAAFLSADPMTAAGWSTRLTENSPSAMPIDVPLLVVQGLSDTLVRPPVTT
ncbi:MAG: lipase family protein, partial [Ilumatobacteraceae bacterium]